MTPHDDCAVLFSGLIQMKKVVLRLAFLPGVVTEGPVITLLAHFLLDLPLLWALMLGFILAAVSPAVVVPSLLGLQSRGYGVDQGVSNKSPFSFPLPSNFSNSHVLFQNIGPNIDNSGCQHRRYHCHFCLFYCSHNQLRRSARGNRCGNTTSTSRSYHR